MRAGTRGARGAAPASSASRCDEIDITGVPELERTYREWIPVVEVDGERVSVYRVEEEPLRHKLAARLTDFVTN